MRSGQGLRTSRSSNQGCSTSPSRLSSQSQPSPISSSQPPRVLPLGAVRVDQVLSLAAEGMEAVGREEETVGQGVLNKLIGWPGTQAIICWNGWIPTAWAYGWRLGNLSYVERVYIRPRYRHRFKEIMRELSLRWQEKAIKRGMLTSVTKIDKDHPEILIAGRRWGGYVPYADDGRYIWCYLKWPA